MLTGCRDDAQHIQVLCMPATTRELDTYCRVSSSKHLNVTKALRFVTELYQVYFWEFYIVCKKTSGFSEMLQVFYKSTSSTGVKGTKYPCVPRVTQKEHCHSQPDPSELQNILRLDFAWFGFIYNTFRQLSIIWGRGKGSQSYLEMHPNSSETSVDISISCLLLTCE